MTDQHLTDRIPEVAHGGTAWTTAERGHFDACAECRAEWDLVAGAARLGASAESVDSERLAWAVKTRLRADQALRAPRRTAWASRWWMPAAAAAAIMVAVAIPRAPAGEVVETVASASAPLPELDSLNEQELEAVLHTVAEPGVRSEEASLGELNPDELEQLLHSLEG